MLHNLVCVCVLRVKKKLFSALYKHMPHATSPEAHASPPDVLLLLLEVSLPTCGHELLERLGRLLGFLWFDREKHLRDQTLDASATCCPS